MLVIADGATRPDFTIDDEPQVGVEIILGKNVYLLDQPFAFVRRL
jgi:hypothetical protein